jgi:hypothetical protein
MLDLYHATREALIRIILDHLDQVADRDLVRQEGERMACGRRWHCSRPGGHPDDPAPGRRPTGPRHTGTVDTLLGTPSPGWWSATSPPPAPMVSGSTTTAGCIGGRSAPTLNMHAWATAPGGMTLCREERGARAADPRDDGRNASNLTCRPRAPWFGLDGPDRSRSS